MRLKYLAIIKLVNEKNKNKNKIIFILIPGLKVIKQDLFVVVPSGNTQTWSGQIESGFVLFLISLMTANLFLESSRVTDMGCNAFTKMPIKGIFSLAALKTTIIINNEYSILQKCKNLPWNSIR